MLPKISPQQIVAARLPIPPPERSLISNHSLVQTSAFVNSLGLTARQLEVLAVLVQGKSNKAICRVLNLAEPTVKNHITAILKSLNVTNRTEAVIKVTKASSRSYSYSPCYSFTGADYSMFNRV